MEEEIRQRARQTVSELVAVGLLGGAVLGFLVFGLMVLLGTTAFKLIGLAGIGGLIAGLYCFFHPPR